MTGLFATRERFKEKFCRSERLEVIVPVDDEPTEWVGKIEIAVKSGDFRICIDPKPLNTALKIERHTNVMDNFLPERAKAWAFT